MEGIGVVAILIAITFLGGFVGSLAKEAEIIRMCDKAGIYLSSDRIVTCSVKEIGKK